MVKLVPELLKNEKQELERGKERALEDLRAGKDIRTGLIW
jgi:hypothetical protein